MGMVSSKTASLVKLRMEKLSSHFSGQSLAEAAACDPLGRYCTRTLRANIFPLFQHWTRPRGLDLLRHIELLDVLGELLSQLGGLLVVRGLVLPDVAGVEQFGGNIRAGLRDGKPEC